MLCMYIHTETCTIRFIVMYIYICIYIYRYIHTCIALHYVTLRYVALHCISLPYVALHYIHTYIHSFITKTYKHMWLQVDWNTYTMLYTYLYTSANAWQCNMGDVTGFQTKVATAYNSNSNNSNNNTNTNTTNDNSGAVVTITTATMTMTTSTATTTTTGTTSTKKKKNKKKKKKNNKKKKRKHKQKQSWINWIKRFPTQNQKTFCPSAGQSCGDDWKLTSESVSMLQFVQHCSIYGSQNCPCFPEDKAKLCCLCWFRSTFWLVFLSALSIPNNYVFLRTTWLWAKIGYPIIIRWSTQKIDQNLSSPILYQNKSWAICLVATCYISVVSLTACCTCWFVKKTQQVQRKVIGFKHVGHTLKEQDTRNFLHLTDVTFKSLLKQSNSHDATRTCTESLRATVWRYHVTQAL